MAQGTALQALARGAQRLNEPSYLDVASARPGRVRRGTPTGVRSVQGEDDWYPLYSFAPRMNVLNGMLQAVNGIRTYAEIASDSDRAAALRGRRPRGAPQHLEL